MKGIYRHWMETNKQCNIVGLRFDQQEKTVITVIAMTVLTMTDGDGDDNEPMWTLDLASAWVLLDATSGSHALAESEPLITTTAFAMLPPKRPTVPRARCVAEARSNNEHITRSLYGLPSLVNPFRVCHGLLPKLQADISVRVNLLRLANLPPTFSNRARPESRRFG
jgi:hypothetical protein